MRPLCGELVAHCCSGASGITPSDVALSGLDQADLDRLGTALDLRGIEDVYPLSPMQQGMLFHALRDGDNDAYVNQVGLELFGFDADKLRTAWQAVNDRHAALRTGFVWQHLSGRRSRWCTVMWRCHSSKRIGAIGRRR